MKNVGLIPLRNFDVIDEEHQFYRSAQPLYGYEYQWLSRVLNIRHLINLRKERDETLSIPADLDMNVYNLEVKDHCAPDLKQVKRYMELVKYLKGPTLIHCEHGHGRTSTFSVLTKIAFGMTLDEALKDEKERFHYQFTHHHQEEFLTEYYNLHFKGQN